MKATLPRLTKSQQDLKASLSLAQSLCLDLVKEDPFAFSTSLFQRKLRVDFAGPILEARTFFLANFPNHVLVFERAIEVCFLADTPHLFYDDTEVKRLLQDFAMPSLSENRKWRAFINDVRDALENTLSLLKHHIEPNEHGARLYVSLPESPATSAVLRLNDEGGEQVALSFSAPVRDLDGDFQLSPQKGSWVFFRKLREIEIGIPKIDDAAIIRGALNTKNLLLKCEVPLLRLLREKGQETCRVQLEDERLLVEIFHIKADGTTTADRIDAVLDLWTSLLQLAKR